MEDDGIKEVLRNKRMGHKSGKMSQHYAHVTADMEEELMKALAKRWKTRSPRWPSRSDASCGRRGAGVSDNGGAWGAIFPPNPIPTQ